MFSINFADRTEKIDLLLNGVPITFDEDKALKILQHKEIAVNISLDDGTASATAWGCDLSYDYIKINGDYRT